MGSSLVVSQEAGCDVQAALEACVTAKDAERRHGVVEGAVLCALELAEVDEALVVGARREPRRRSRCL